MSVFGAIANVLGGGLVSPIVEAIEKYFPPSMTDEQKAAIRQAATVAAHQHELDLLNVANAQDHEFNERIKAMEGTAADLKAVPVLGPLVLFLRGLQRPTWGFGALFLDWMSFSGSWVLTDRQETILLVVNLLVLGFLFGERAIKNVMPLLAAYFGKGAAYIPPTGNDPEAILKRITAQARGEKP